MHFSSSRFFVFLLPSPAQLSVDSQLHNCTIMETDRTKTVSHSMIPHVDTIDSRLFRMGFSIRELRRGFGQCYDSKKKLPVQSTKGNLCSLGFTNSGDSGNAKWRWCDRLLAISGTTYLLLQ